MASKFEAFLAANPTDYRVVRIFKLWDRHGPASQTAARLVGELMREVETA